MQDASSHECPYRMVPQLTLVMVMFLWFCVAGFMVAAAMFLPRALPQAYKAWRFWRHLHGSAR